MKRALKGIVTLGVVAGCGGLAASTGQDASTDRAQPRPWTPARWPWTLARGTLWGSGPSDVWTVGVGEIAEVLHWDGSLLERLHGVHVPEWSLYTVPDYSWGGLFYAVWGSGAGDVWIAGQGAMFHHS
jgi:hypothetical protein